MKCSEILNVSTTHNIQSVNDNTHIYFCVQWWYSTEYYYFHISCIMLKLHLHPANFNSNFVYTSLPHSLDFPNTRCTHVNSLHVETVKYLINKNYCSLITINIKNCTYSCLKTNSFFSRSTNKKPQVNKKSRASYHVYIRNRTLKSTVLPNAEEKGNTWNMLASPGLCVRQHCQQWMLGFYIKYNFLRQNE